MSLFQAKRSANTIQMAISHADAARDSKSWRKAVAYYEEAVAAAPDLAGIWVQLGHCRKETGQLASAEAAYRRSLEIDGQAAETHLQLGHVLKLQGKHPQARASYLRAVALNSDWAIARAEVDALDAPLLAARLESGSRLVFDCSDLIQYFDNNRLPTGVQRVQINIASAALADAARAEHCRTVFYSGETDAWHVIAPGDFLALTGAAARISVVDDATWRELRNRLAGPTRSNRFDFAAKDVLISLGTSWWLEDHVLLIRTLRREKAVRFIPLIYDCIPLVTPEHCAPYLVEQFRIWIEAMLRNSDGLLACSQSTARDLQAVATSLALPSPDVRVIQLDGDLRAAGPPQSRGALERLFEEVGLPTGARDQPGYALCVSTLESRKNHLLLFQAWDMMIERRGAERVPHLLCVGKPGYLFDAPLNFLKVRPQLEAKVRFLDGIDDSSLGALYAAAKFTVYPSFYEGWGLPVTESLCFGKAVASSIASSLPEAGGEHALYFDPYGVREACGVIEQLAFNRDRRKDIEAKIARSFKPRSWAAIASLVLDAAQAAAERCETAPGIQRSGIPELAWSALYAMRGARFVQAGAAPSGEDLRLGEGWHRCEDWGVWTRSRRATVLFRLPEAISGALSLYLLLKAPPATKLRVTFTARSTKERREIDLTGDVPQYVRVIFDESPGATLERELVIEASRLTDLGAFTDNRDRRLIGCGLLQIGVCPDTDLPSRIAMLEAMTFSMASPAASG